MENTKILSLSFRKQKAIKKRTETHEILKDMDKIKTINNLNNKTSET